MVRYESMSAEKLRQYQANTQARIQQYQQQLQAVEARRRAADSTARQRASASEAERKLSARLAVDRQRIARINRAIVEVERRAAQTPTQRRQEQLNKQRGFKDENALKQGIKRRAGLTEAEYQSLQPGAKRALIKEARSGRLRTTQDQQPLGMSYEERVAQQRAQRVAASNFSSITGNVENVPPPASLSGNFSSVSGDALYIPPRESGRPVVTRSDANISLASGGVGVASAPAISQFPNLPRGYLSGSAGGLQELRATQPWTPISNEKLEARRAPRDNRWWVDARTDEFLRSRPVTLAFNAFPLPSPQKTYEGFDAISRFGAWSRERGQGDTRSTGMLKRTGGAIIETIGETGKGIVTRPVSSAIYTGLGFAGGAGAQALITRGIFQASTVRAVGYAGLGIFGGVGVADTAVQPSYERRVQTASSYLREGSLFYGGARLGGLFGGGSWTTRGPTRSLVTTKTPGQRPQTLTPRQQKLFARSQDPSSAPSERDAARTLLQRSFNLGKAGMVGGGRGRSGIALTNTQGNIARAQAVRRSRGFPRPSLFALDFSAFESRVVSGPRLVNVGSRLGAPARGVNEPRRFFGGPRSRGQLITRPSSSIVNRGGSSLRVVGSRTITSTTQRGRATARRGRREVGFLRPSGPLRSPLLGTTSGRGFLQPSPRPSVPARRSTGGLPRIVEPPRVPAIRPPRPPPPRIRGPRDVGRPRSIRRTGGGRRQPPKDPNPKPRGGPGGGFPGLPLLPLGGGGGFLGGGFFGSRGRIGRTRAGDVPSLLAIDLELYGEGPRRLRGKKKARKRRRKK